MYVKTIISHLYFLSTRFYTTLIFHISDLFLGFKWFCYKNFRTQVNIKYKMKWTDKPCSKKISNPIETFPSPQICHTSVISHMYMNNLAKWFSGKRICLSYGFWKWSLKTSSWEKTHMEVWEVILELPIWEALNAHTIFHSFCTVDEKTLS